MSELRIGGKRSTQRHERRPAGKRARQGQLVDILVNSSENRVARPPSIASVGPRPLSKLDLIEVREGKGG